MARTKKDYQEYLQSDHWKTKRREFWASKRGRTICICCFERPATQVHHNNYSRLGKEKLRDLKAVCGPCHQALHDLVKDGCALAGAATKLRAQLRRERRQK